MGLMSFLLVVLTLLVGWLVGGLPLGSMIIRRLTGKDPAAYAAHNLGVENVRRHLGPRVAVASFGTDVLRGFAAGALAAARPWGALGLYAWHPHTPLARWRGRSARRR